jgi:TonB family protein
LPEVKDALRKAKVKNVDVWVLYSKITFDQKIDNLSEFSMGILNLNKWISQNLNYQPSETEKNIEGIVYTRIIIDEKGKVKDVYILRGINPDLDEKVWRLLSSMTKWDPGKYQGKSMNVQCYIPVHFDLSKHPTQQVFVY